MTRRLKYPIAFDNSKRVFFEFGAFVRFFGKSRRSVKNFKINPPRIGDNNFGSIEVKF